MNSKKRNHNYIYKHKRRTIIILSVILLMIIYLFKDAGVTLRAVSAGSLFLFFYFVDRFFNVQFKPIHYLFIIAMGIIGILLSPLYFIYPNYDKIQHLVNPILLSVIIFYMISKLNLKMEWKLAFTFFVTFGIVGFIEIGEYGLDKLFNLNLQGVYLRDIKGLEKLHLLLDPLDDTMIDIILGLIGSGIYTASGIIKNWHLIKKEK